MRFQDLLKLQSLMNLNVILKVFYGARFIKMCPDIFIAFRKLVKYIFLLFVYYSLTLIFDD